MVWQTVGCYKCMLKVFDLHREMVLKKEGKTITIQGNLIEKNNRYFITRTSNLSFYSPSLLLRGGDFKPEEWGYRVRIRAVVRSFNSCSNPGVMDFRLFWGRKRVPAYLEVESWEVVSPPRGWFSLMHQVEEKKGEFLSSWKEELKDEYLKFSSSSCGSERMSF